MSKLILSDVAAGYNLQKINDNFDKIQDALNNGVLWRENPVGEANQMENLLDMNGNRVINVVLVIPASPAGLPSGAIWNDSGTVRVVA